MYFQTSGQGPYFGQAAWFLLYHPEPVDSAKDRYVAETRRVAGVLNAWLSERAKEASAEDTSAKAKGLTGPAKDAQGNVWLIGNKITYVDLMFGNWKAAVGMFVQMSGMKKEDWDPETQFPHFWKRQSVMMGRPSFQKVGAMQKVEDVHL